MKLEYMGTHIDILYCAMITQNIPVSPDYLKQISNARYEKVNSLSFMGWKTCQVMLGMIPNLPTFGTALKIIKTWAKRRGIYGFNYGYLNGISLVIMLIKI